MDVCETAHILPATSLQLNGRSINIAKNFSGLVQIKMTAQIKMGSHNYHFYFT